MNHTLEPLDARDLKFTHKGKAVVTLVLVTKDLLARRAHNSKVESRQCLEASQSIGFSIRLITGRVSQSQSTHHQKW